MRSGGLWIGMRPKLRSLIKAWPMIIFSFSLTVFITILCFANLSQPAYAQPPQWRIEAYFLPLGQPSGSGEPKWLEEYGDRFFPGEVGNLTFQLVNTDCESRARDPHLRRFIQTWEDDMKPIFKRLEKMKTTGYILNYSVKDTNIAVYGDRKIADWDVTVTGYCVGRSIHVESAKVWFAWPGYGEALSSSIPIQRTLAAVDPIKYIFEGEARDSTIIFTIPFSFPSDIPSQLFEIQPTITLALRYPSGYTYEYQYGPLGSESHWWLWGPSGSAYGLFRLSPYRTFSLKITDHEGAMPLGNATLLLSAHMYPYSLFLMADQEGVARFERLPDFYTYTLRIVYKPPLIGDNVVVYTSTHEAIELASIEMIRVDLYTLRVYPIDQQGRPLINATVLLRLIEEPQTGRTAQYLNQSSTGYASFYLLPTGNYSIVISWRGVEVHSALRYIGYHPTYGFSPLSFTAVTAVSDLIVSAVDMAGNQVGAVFTVEGPTPESSYMGIERKDGVLVTTQQPIATYLVTAVNVSTAFNLRISASSLVRPGEPAKITLPIYSIRFKIFSMDEKPVPNADIIFHTITARSDVYGDLTIPGVPQGFYNLRIIYHNVSVYSDEVRVEGNLILELHVKLYDVNASFEDSEGSDIIVEWRLSGPGGNYTGIGSRLYAPLLPDVAHRLVAYFLEDGKQMKAFDADILPSQSRGSRLRLPISTARFSVFWRDGTPFNGTILVEGVRYPISSGLAKIGKLLHRTLNISVERTDGIELLRDEVQHTGEGIQVIIPQTFISITVQDIFFRPVEGARIVVYSLRKPGLVAASASTGADGTVYFNRLPEALAPYRVQVSLGGETFEAFASGGVLNFRLNSLVVSGTPIPSATLLGILVLVIAVALVAALIGRIRSSRAEGRAEGE